MALNIILETIWDKLYQIKIKAQFYEEREDKMPFYGKVAVDLMDIIEKYMK